VSFNPPNQIKMCIFLQQKRNEMISWVLSTSIVLATCLNVEEILN
jgi:hypothetical protein